MNFMVMFSNYKQNIFIVYENEKLNKQATEAGSSKKPNFLNLLC